MDKMSKKALPPYEELHRLFEYVSGAGHLLWRNRDDVRQSTISRWAGKPAGARKRYVLVSIQGYGLCAAHRIIWKMIYGTEPAEIDHIDCDKHNNRIENLREASRTQNHANRRVRRDSASGIKGVYWEASRQRWHAKIRINGRQTHLGRFNTVEAARAAYVDAANRAYGEFARAA